MIISCPTCGQRCPVEDNELSMTIHCHCGGRFLASGAEIVPPEIPTASEEQIAQRKEVCSSCDQFHDDRCNQFDMGCRRTFLANQRAAEGKCPLALWN
jgi:hypothetical protein